MSFRIVGLAPEAYAHLWRASAQELEQVGARRMVVTEKPGAPCRVSLDDAEIGEDVILLSHEHQPNATAYRQQGPIFIRDIGRRFDQANSIPPAFARRPLSLRAFDDAHMMVDAELTDGAEAGGLIERLLANPAVAYIHAHYARRGCYAGLIERA